MAAGPWGAWSGACCSSGGPGQASASGGLAGRPVRGYMTGRLQSGPDEGSPHETAGWRPHGGAGAGAHSGRPEPNVRSSESQASVLFGGPSPASTPRDHGQASTPGARTQRHSAKLQLGAPLKPEFSAAPRSHRRALSPGRRRSACRPRHLSRAPPPRVPGQRYSATPQAGSVIEKHAPAPFRGIAAGRRHRGAWAGATPRGRSRAPSPRGPRPCPKQGTRTHIRRGEST